MQNMATISWKANEFAMNTIQMTLQKNKKIYYNHFLPYTFKKGVKMMKKNMIKWIFLLLGVLAIIIPFAIKGSDNSLIVIIGIVLVIIFFVLNRREKDAKARDEGRPTSKEIRQEKKMEKAKKKSERAERLSELVDELGSSVTSGDNHGVTL